MYTEKQLERLFEKLKRFEKMLEPRIFVPVDCVPMRSFQTDGSHHSVPDDDCFEPCEAGTVFEGEGIYCWFKGVYTVPESLDGKNLFIYPRIRGYEGMLWVDGKPYGNFASKFIEHSHGNHYCDLLRQGVRAGESIDIALEYYANHYIKGTQPFLIEAQRFYRIVYDRVDICLKDEELAEFYFDLKVVNQMVKVLDKDDFRRADFTRALLKIHEFVSYDIDDADPETFREEIRRADAVLKDVLQAKNSGSAPYAGLIGHSHMDTAWLWHRGETEKKCARTYSNQMNLMDQYPEYTFIQSSAYHADIIKRMYPALFADMKKRIAEGRYEPNGGVWIECDCNIPSGEYMIRQFVWGQKFTRENFNYTSDAFWLPDTFGYSASLPQIMRGCHVKYFLTTKIAWNDTNVFPYDTFYWKGIDGSKVLVHFNRTHVWPDPETLSGNLLKGGDNTIKERAVSRSRLISYGFGDGGGGPEFGMIEMARRLEDLEGMPRTAHTTVSRFMQELESSLADPSVYSGELYLELHRGTLTNQHVIKRNNRKAEFKLRDLEYLTVRDAVERGCAASATQIDPLTCEMLVNQFHDILPGTCIPRVHDEAVWAVTHIMDEAERLTDEILSGAVHRRNSAVHRKNGDEDTKVTGADGDDAADADSLRISDLGDQPAGGEREPARQVTVVNTLSFPRTDVLYLPFEGRYIDHFSIRQEAPEADSLNASAGTAYVRQAAEVSAGTACVRQVTEVSSGTAGAGEAAEDPAGAVIAQQVTEDLDGQKKLAVSGVRVPAFGSVVLAFTDEHEEEPSPFWSDGSTLITPLYTVRFNEKGYIDSLVDKRNGREFRGEGYALNTLLMAKEVSLSWDNWDLDADCESLFADTASLLSCSVVSDGAVEYRIRSSYRLSSKSTLEQDMIFYASSPEIVFETRMNWQDDHHFLKTAFDTTIHTDYACHEVQFGYIRRTVNRNTSIEKARFEVSNHKYTDLSETRCGAALLNDCKYGISVRDSQMRLSLHKGGCMPDFRGDKGMHACTYAFLPHMGSLSADNVIRPAYMLNEKPILVDGALPMESFVRLNTDHVIVETVKPMEESGKGFILRLYEAEGAADTVTVSFGFPVKDLAETDMLEEVLREFGEVQQLTLSFRPFEIKTVRVLY